MVDYADQSGTMDTSEGSSSMRSVAPVFDVAQTEALRQAPEPIVLPAPAIVPDPVLNMPARNAGGPAAEQPEMPQTVDYDYTPSD